MCGSIHQVWLRPIGLLATDGGDHDEIARFWMCAECRQSWWKEKFDLLAPIELR